MAGAASHIDLWDYKPQLEKHHGESSDFGEHVEAFQDGLGPWMKSPFQFSRYGQCGKAISEVVAPLGDCVDDIAFVHNMVGKTGVHSQATYLQATGFDRPGFPGMGSWVSYAMGSLNDNLPTFVVLPDHRGFASNGPKNWGSGFLPASTQGTMIFPQRDDAHRRPERDRRFCHTDKQNPTGSPCCRSLNQSYSRQRPGDSRLEARLRSYELAAKMQLSAPEVFDLQEETAATLKMYGIDNPGATYPAEINIPEEAEYFGRKCLIARRMLERGVRIYSDLVRKRQRISTPKLGQSRRHRTRSQAAGDGNGDWNSGADQRSRNSAACWTTRSFCGRRNSVACHRRRAARDVITILTCLPTGSAVAEFAAESATDRPMNGVTNHLIATIQLRCMTSTPRHCICWESITPN